MNDMNQLSIQKIDIGKIYEDIKTPLIVGKSSTESSNPTEFKNILGGFMEEVNNLQLKADDKLEKLTTGEVKDLHQVMIAVSEADTSFKIMMDIRNKLVTAYKEVMKLGGGA